MAGRREKSTQKPLPKYLKDHKKVNDECNARLEEFKDYCCVLKGEAKDGEGVYRKNYVQNLKKAAESYDIMNKGLFKSYPIEVDEHFREKMAEVIVEMDLLPIFCDHVKELLPARPKDKTQRDVLDWCMKPIMNSCYYLADATRIVVGHPNYMQTVADFIKGIEKKPDKFWAQMLQWALYQTLNVSRVDDNVDQLQDIGFESILKGYTEHHLSDHRLASLATLANVVDEDDETGEDPKETSKTATAKQASKTGTTEAVEPGSRTNVYKTTVKSIDFLMGRIKDASSNKSGISDGWPLASLLEVVGNLARNSHNSRLLVQRGCLPYLAKLANTGDPEAETIAARSLESLAFNEENAADMVTLKDFDLIVILGDLYRVDRGEDLRFHASGALFTLKEKLKKTGQHLDKVRKIEGILPLKQEKRDRPARPGKSDDLPTTQVQSVQEATERWHISPEAIVCQETQLPDGSVLGTEQGRLQVMLSYNRNHREKVRDICMFLLEKGYKVWFDMNDMTGDTNQAMASAIEKSHVICVCFSRAYKRSKYCRREAEYADALDKPLLPLKMESYNPTGWLGFLIRPMLYVDFTGKYPEEEQRTKMLKELERKKDKQEENSSDDEKANQ